MAYVASGDNAHGQVASHLREKMFRQATALMDDVTMRSKPQFASGSKAAVSVLLTGLL